MQQQQSKNGGTATNARYTSSLMLRTLSPEEISRGSSQLEELDKDHCNTLTYLLQGKDIMKEQNSGKELSIEEYAFVLNPFQYVNGNTWSGKNWATCFAIYCNKYNDLLAALSGDSNTPAINYRGILEFVDSPEFEDLCDDKLAKITRSEEINFFRSVQANTRTGMVEISQTTGPNSKASMDEGTWRNLLTNMHQAVMGMMESPNRLEDISIKIGPNGFFSSVLLRAPYVTFFKPILKKENEEYGNGCRMSVFSYLIVRLVVDKRIIQCERASKAKRSNHKFREMPVDMKSLVSELINSSSESNGIYPNVDVDKLVEKLMPAIERKLDTIMENMEKRNVENQEAMVTKITRILFGMTTKNNTTKKN